MAPFQEQEGVMTEKVEEQADDNADVADDTQDEAKDGQKDLKAALEKADTERKRLEQALSKQGYELGELRKLTDKILTEQASKKDEPVDFFADPDKAVDKKIAGSPALQEAIKRANEAKQAAAQLHLMSAHPDYKEIVVSTDFQAWIGKSKVRQALFSAAHTHYDVDAAEELLSNWKERTQLLAKKKEEADEETKSKLKDAKVDTGNSGVSGKKVYSRVELMRLKTQDPDKYRSLNVVQLYAEGRVK